MGQTFELTDDHLKLIKGLYFERHSSIPQIDSKRPLGSNSTEDTIADILGWSYDREDGVTDEQYNKAGRILEELSVALQICTSNLTFETGTYMREKDYYDLSWRKCE